MSTLIVTTAEFVDHWSGDVRHRADGPALAYPDGYREWWVDGVFVASAERGQEPRCEPGWTVDVAGAPVAAYDAQG